MNCNEFIERILDHALLEQTAAEPEAVAHLDGCPACRERLEFERTLAAGFSAIVSAEPPAEMASRILDIPERLKPVDQPAAIAEPSAVLEKPRELPPELPAELPAAQPARSRPEAPFREIPWWQGFWFKAGLSFATAGFLLAVGVTQLLTTESGVTEKRAESARTAPATEMAAKSELPAGVPAVPDAAVGAAADGEVASALAQPTGMMMAAAPVAPSAPEEQKAQIALPAAPPPPPPAFRAGSGESAGGTNMTESRPADSLSMAESGATKIETAGELPAQSDGSRVRNKDRREDESKLPIVIGEPLIGAKDKKDVKPTAVKPVPAAVPVPAPSKPSALIVRPAEPAENAYAKVESVKQVGEIMLRETPDDRKQAADELAADSEAGFAPPPPAKSMAAVSRSNFVEESGTAVSPRKQARIEEIMSAHPSGIKAGTLDIDQWVLSGWITVKERIDIAPPHGMKWIAVKSGRAWRAELRPSR